MTDIDNKTETTPTKAAETEKHPGGRPRKFQDIEELQRQIDLYFAQCTKEKEPYTITGLAMALDSSRKALLEIEANYDEEFGNAIKRAKLRVENDYEKALRKNGRAGEIFGLKNFGWKDQQNVQVDAEVKHGISDDLKALIEDIVA